MEKIRFDVVGLYHWDVRNNFKEYAAEAVGKKLTLQPQPENVKDPYAVRAREGRLHIGYVAVPDLDVVYQAMAGSGLQRLRGVVISSNPEPPVLTVECAVERIDWDCEPFDDSPYEGWHYDGLPLIPRKMEELSDLTLDLIDALETQAPVDDELLGMAETLLKENLYDVSREMTRARYRLERLLSAHEDPKLQQLAERFQQQKGMLMRHMYRDHVARYLFVDIPRELLNKGLETSHYTYDNRLHELESQLSAFPYQLYDKFLADPVDFLREVYYKHVPRRYLNQLLSGIILMILKGKVEIERWGREGDKSPIEKIKELGHPQNHTDRMNAIKKGLKELLEKVDARGNLIIYQKNQWAAIMSVLVQEYSVTENDMKAFCRKMEEWGFGPGSQYEKCCDYESLSKASAYAQRSFADWQGRGTQHQRMVRAAIELRDILRPVIGHT